jgi:hypothetical protein
MTAHVMPDMSHSLLSIGQFCDAGCEAVFDAKRVAITHNKQQILTGYRDWNGLWKIAIPKPQPQAHFSVHDATTRQIIKFLHLTLFSPTKSTLLKAIQNNHFVGWPALTQENVVKHLRLEEPTILGHMDQQRQHTRSTKTRTTEHSNSLPSEVQENEADTHDIDGQSRTRQAFVAMHDLPTGRVYTDQTGSFPVVSAQGTKAIMVLYDHDSNAILVEGITSRGKTELVRAYKMLLNRLRAAGVNPTVQRMDNEVSNIFKEFLQQENIGLELTPSHIHRR